MRAYHEWIYGMFPHGTFDDIAQTMEKFGGTFRVKEFMHILRERHEHPDDDDDKQQQQQQPRDEQQQPDDDVDDSSMMRPPASPRKYSATSSLSLCMYYVLL